MAGDFPITEKGKPSWFQAHDWQLWAIIAATVVLVLALLIPLVGTLRFMNGYHDFMRELNESALYGREHGSTTITLDGTKQKPNFDGVSDAIGNISDASVGRPNDAEPNGGILIAFGDGTTLSLSPVAITTENRLSDMGVLVRYTRADGSVYAYDTDRMSYEALCDVLHLPS